MGAAGQSSEWATYRNERFGFSLRYPKDVFATERTSESRDGEVFVGMRGHGRLLVGAFVNEDRHTVDSYRRFIAKQSYSEFDISYAPRGGTWFVLSGEGSGSVFYEKVMFSCAGRVINSFVLMYPVESKREFDPIVESIEKTFRPGRDCERSARR
jgi:hypothetical protein